MRYILDSHLLIWSLFNDEKLPPAAYDIINNQDNEIFYSTASIWELDIKHAKAPEKMPVSGKAISDWCESADMTSLPILKEHVFQISALRRDENAPAHNDPFDRILIAQAKAEDMILLTHDKLLKDYAEQCVKLV